MAKDDEETVFMEHVGLLLALQTRILTEEVGKEDNPDNPGDRNSMKKCMEEVFSETAPETDSHWQ